MRLGFIGCGNMAGAIIAGIIKKGLVSPDEIYGSNSTLEHANATHERLGIQTSTDNTLVAGESDIVFLCVKPQQYEAVIDQIKDHLHEHQILVSIAPGKTLAWLGEKISHPQKIVRVMPNTPALVGEGTTAFCPGDLGFARRGEDREGAARKLRACDRACRTPHGCRKRSRRQRTRVRLYVHRGTSRWRSC